MSESLKKKRQTRNGRRLALHNLIEKIRAAVPPNGEQASPSLHPKLEGWKNGLEKQRQDIEELDKEILALLEADEEINSEIMEKAEIEQKIEENLCIIAHALKERAVVEVASVSSPQVPNFDRVKLPKLQLTYFNGDPTKWMTFWDSFSSTIHESTNLSNIDKFKYLQQSLVGAAAETIAGLTITNDNYKEAIELLKKRFGDKQIILSKHIEHLMEIPKVTLNEDLKKLRTLLDKTETTVRSLRNMKVPTSNYSIVLTPIIMSKLPQELRLFISRQLSDEWDLDGLLKHLGDELNVREKCAMAPIGSSSSSNFQTRPNLSFRKPASTTSTLLVDHERQASNTNNKLPSCLFCSNRHYSSSCTIVTNPDQRKAIIKEKRRCFVCLKIGHNSRQCTSSTRCYKCNGRHHTSICGSNSNVQGINAAQSTGQSQFDGHVTQVIQNNPSVSSNPNFKANVSTNSLHVSNDLNRNSVLLQTARATVQNDIYEPGNSCNVRLILDNGSQKSYISARVQKQLKLQPIKTDKVLIKGFGDTTGTLKHCDLVKLADRGSDN